MAKKSITDQFRDFVRALPTQSNVPMTAGEIMTAGVKKKRKAATKRRSSKLEKKKTAKAAKKPKNAKKKSKR